MLTMFCIDEVHLFVVFRLSFRKDFCKMKDTLLSSLLSKDNDTRQTKLIVPFLCMPATFNNELLLLLERMIGMNFSQQCVFWSNKKRFQKRYIHIQLQYSNKKKRFLKQQLHSYLSCNIKAKAIICGNVTKSLIAIQDEVRLWMTDPSSIIHGTTTLVIGSEDTVRKQLHPVEFASSFSNEEIEDPTVFTPHILIGTSGCIGTGIDCDDISLVACLGMPTSLMHLI